MDCIECEELLLGRRKKYCSGGCQKRAGRRAWVMKVYGLTLEEYDVILEFQGGVCGICRRSPKTNETFHIDHEHSGGPSGIVRGILCPYCNTRLVGRLKSHQRAQQLADYLREPPATAALGRVVIAAGRPRVKKQPRKRAR